MKITNWLLVAMVSVGLALSGCGKKEEGGSGSVSVKQGSAKDALATLDAALRAKDAKAFAAVVVPEFSAPMEKMMGAMMTMTTKQAEVKKTVTDKLGKETADTLFPDSGERDLAPLAKATKDGKVDWEKVKVEESGDKATVLINGKAEDDLIFKKVNGKWYADVPGKTPEDAVKQADATVGMSEKMVKALDVFQKAVQAGTVTKENAMMEYGKAMSAAMGGGGE